MHRRHFLQGTAMAALAAPSIARAQAKSIKVALGWINNVEYAGVWMGLENGYFKEEGLDVKTLPGGPNAPPPPVTVASGGAEIGYGNWLPYLDALARGNDFVLLAGTFPVSPLGILSLPGKPILIGLWPAGAGAQARNRVIVLLGQEPAEGQDGLVGLSSRMKIMAKLREARREAERATIAEVCHVIHDRRE